MNIIEKIKVEIDRRIKENESWKVFHRFKGETTNFDDVKIVELQSILSFISTLESENHVPVDLEEAAIRYATHKKKSEEKEMETELPMVAYYLAKDSFIAGAKWKENKDQEIIKLAEDHAFLAGADWQKEQMIKESVEGEMMDFRFLRENDYSSARIEFSTIPDLKVGDKVRIIIVKED